MNSFAEPRSRRIRTAASEEGRLVVQCRKRRRHNEQFGFGFRFRIVRVLFLFLRFGRRRERSWPTARHAAGDTAAPKACPSIDPGAPFWGRGQFPGVLKSRNRTQVRQAGHSRTRVPVASAELPHTHGHPTHSTAQTRPSLIGVLFPFLVTYGEMTVPRSDAVGLLKARTIALRLLDRKCHLYCSAKMGLARSE